MTHFPPFTFEPRDRTLRRDAIEIALTPKAAALLACLLDARGAWVSKDAILAAVWPDTHVQPENIKVLVREIRNALGDSTVAPSFIGSMPRRGYAFVAPILERPPTSAVDGMLAPRTPIFVHRAAEIAALTSALVSAPEAGPRSAPRLALVSGDHGSGKTLLGEAFLRGVRASGTARICYAKCSDRELAPEPYYPILDALLRLERHYPGVARGALAEHAPAWLALFPEWSAAPRRLSESRQPMLDQLSAAIAAMTRDMPLVMVLDDVQWADAETLQALRLSAAATPSRALFVATSSEGAWVAGAGARSAVTADRGTFSIALPPFTRKQTSQYILARFGSGPIESLALPVYGATGGNPLLVSSAFDGLIARGLIAAAPCGGWRRETSPAALSRAIPETLADLVAGQLELLELHERAAIEAAAAVGYEFTLGDVAVALRSDASRAGAIIGPLARRGQLVVAAGSRGIAAAGDGHREADSYRFRHPFYVGVIARRAPQLRQRAFATRVSGLRRLAHRLAT